jgi:2-polyprenyl-3-methyl-5-hydroxy-6-metoxy-1,4-benzoquinol methylase
MLTRMRLERYIERDQEILSRVTRRRVLHLGCVGFTDCPVDVKVSLARQSLHQQLTDCSECVGVDLDRESVRQLQERGIFKNVVFGDVERLEELSADLGKFDAVVAGDIIEHVSNPGRMLDGILTVLKPTGELILSTPNSMGLPAYIRYVTGGFREGAQHVLCFNAITLKQLLLRHGYKVTEAMSCYQSRARGIHRLSFAAGSAFLKRFPKFGGTLLYVARRAEDSAPGLCSDA